MKERDDSQVFFKTDISITAIEEYIDKKKEEGITLGIMDVIFATVIRMISERPLLNRFCINGMTYARNEITTSLSKISSLQAFFSSSEIYESLVNAVYAEKLYADLQIDRDSFAAHMNLSRHSLNMILRTNTKGLSFPQWLNTIRIEIASEMLQNEPEKPIAIIAKEVGLTPNNFHRLFRLRFGVTPTEYRQSKDTDTEGMFENSTKLVGGKGTIFSPAATDASRAKIDGGKANPGYFTAKK